MPRWTEFDLNAYQARLKASNERLEVLEGCDDESELHEQIRQECLRRGWLAFHGSMAHATFRTEGEFDFVILCEFPTVLLIEAKTKTGKLSTAQLGIHAWAARLKHQPHTVRSMDEFLRIANSVTKPPHDNARGSQGSDQSGIGEDNTTTRPNDQRHATQTITYKADRLDRRTET